jgi:hypothetical protein
MMAGHFRRNADPVSHQNFGRDRSQAAVNNRQNVCRRGMRRDDNGILRKQNRAYGQGINVYRACHFLRRQQVTLF